MKNITISLFLVSSLFSPGALAQTGDYNLWLLQQRLPDWTEELLSDDKFKIDYHLSTFINPFYLEADFNADGNLDIVVAIERKKDGKKGFLILHGQTKQAFQIGAGIKFDNGGDDFNWMDIWKIHRNLNAHRLTFKDGDIDGSETLKLKSAGIDVLKSESAGGLIYWDGGSYKWAQTRD